MVAPASVRRGDVFLIELDPTRGGEIRLGNSRDLDAKAASALAVLAHLGTGPFTYIDVSTPDRPTSHA